MLELDFHHPYVREAVETMRKEKPKILSGDDQWYCYPEHKPHPGIEVLVCQRTYGCSETYTFTAYMIAEEFAWLQFFHFNPSSQFVKIQRDAQKGDRWRYIYEPEDEEGIK